MRRNYSDITIELLDLSNEIITELTAQLNYYQVSIYKEESLKAIELKIRSLKFISKVLASQDLLDIFEDYHAEKMYSKSLANNAICPFFMRVNRLIQQFKKEITKIQSNSCLIDSTKYDLKKSVIKFKNELVAICPNGSRSRHFFKSF